METKRKRKRFTPEFKAEVVLEALNVETSQAKLCCCHCTAPVNLERSLNQECGIRTLSF